MNSYNQNLTITLKFHYKQSSNYKKDIIIENVNKRLQIYRSVYDKQESELFVPAFVSQEPITKQFSFTLDENSGWVPILSAKDFKTLLSNITSIRIKAAPSDYTFLSSFQLKTAKKTTKMVLTDPAPWVEECKCPESHTGQFCEKCQVGHRRAKPYGDLFTRCIPCSCNNHSSTCDPDSGKCNCMHQTTGDNCERCKEGYYGDALMGTPNDCKKCVCPNDGPCAEIFNFQSNIAEVVCLNCPVGTRGLYSFVSEIFTKMHTIYSVD
jgi:hypothetical protein